MLPSSAKGKGRRFEHFVNKCITDAGLGVAIRTPGSGSGSVKGDSFNNLKFLIEAKNEKQWHWENIDQAKREAKDGNFDRDKWALVFRDPRYPEFQEVYVTIDLNQFLQLLKKDKEPIMKEPDKDMKWKLENLKRSLNEVLKRL